MKQSCDKWHIVMVSSKYIAFQTPKESRLLIILVMKHCALVFSFTLMWISPLFGNHLLCFFHHLQYTFLHLASVILIFKSFV